MNGTAKVVKNTIFSLLARGTELGAGFITIILAARYLGIEAFGEYAFIRAMAFVITPLINFGTERILIRDISVDKSQASFLVCSGLVLNLSIGIFVCIIALIASRIFYESQFFPGSTIIVAIIAQMLQVMTKTIGAVFVAREKIVFDLMATIISRSLIILFFILVACFNMQGRFFFHAFAFANGAGFIFSVIMLKIKFAGSLWAISFSLTGYVIRQSFPLALATFMIQGYDNIFVFYIRLLRDIVEVSIYQAPQRIIQQCLMVPRSFFFAYIPTLSRMAKKGQPILTLLNTYHTIFKYIVIFTLPVSVFATVFADRFIFIFFGPEFADAAYCLQILIWAINLLFINMLMDFLMTSMRKQNFLIVSNALCLTTSSTIGYVLVQEFGYFGACWATLLSYVVLIACNFYFVSKYLGLIPVHRIAIKPVLCCMALAGFLFEYSDNINIITLIILGSIIYIGLLFLFKTFTHKELNSLKYGFIIKFKKFF